jgi:hypothetical protein
MREGGVDSILVAGKRKVVETWVIPLQVLAFGEGGTIFI